MAQKKSKKLNQKQVLAAEMLGQGYRQKEVAERLNLRGETISRWTTLEPFREAIDAASRCLLDEITVDTVKLINKCHEAILKALENDEAPIQSASVAIRYLNTFVKPYTVYNKLAEVQKSQQSNDKFVEAMSQITNIIEQLGYLKSSNSVYTDKEYREHAEQVVRSWGKIDPRYLT